MPDNEQNIFPLSDNGSPPADNAHNIQNETSYNKDTVNSIFDEIMSEVGLSDVKRAPLPQPETEPITEETKLDPEPVIKPSEDETPAKPEISVTRKTYEKLDAAADVAKKGFRTVGRKIQNSDTLRPEVLKDMFFGDKPDPDDILPENAALPYDDIESDQVLFGKKKRRPSDPRGDKMLFRIMYMLTPEQVMDGYMLFYNEFVKKRNVRFTLIMSTLSLVFLIAILMAPQGYISYLLLLVTLLVTTLRWINSWNDRREALASAGDVKNDSYKLSFYNSRILIEASERVNDKVFNYPPVVIRFEDIDLKLLDYDSIYVLVFRKDYIYVLPKESMTERENEVFCAHLKNILSDDFYIFEKRLPKAEDEEEFPTLKDESAADYYPDDNEYMNDNEVKETDEQ